MSEYDNAKRIVKQMRLGKNQAKDIGARAYKVDLAAGRPDIALKCAKEFKLGDAAITDAATALFLELVKRARLDKALDIAKSYNLAHGGPKARQALAAAAKVQYAGGGQALAEIRHLARTASSTGTETTRGSQAVELIEEAGEARDGDERIEGRLVVLPEKGELWLTGDLHGNLDNLRRFVQLADLDNNPQRILVLQEIVHSRFITADNRDLSFVAIMEAIGLCARYPGRVYYMLGNHDLAVHLDRELVKGGKYLNRYLYKGMAYMYKDQYEDVLDAYRQFIDGMPAALIAPNGVFMAHSTPKKPYIDSLSFDYLAGEAALRSLHKLKPVTALVNGRQYDPESADAFADRMECDVMLCGHTPTMKGFRVPNHRHLIIDSQHGKARYVAFDLSKRYASSQELAKCVRRLNPDEDEVDLGSADLM